MTLRTDRSRRYHDRLRQRALWLYLPWCCQCGMVDNLEFAHIMRTKLAGKGRGFNKRYLDILRHPGSYRVMCRRCHAAYDGREVCDGFQSSD